VKRNSNAHQQGSLLSCWDLYQVPMLDTDDDCTETRAIVLTMLDTDDMIALLELNMLDTDDDCTATRAILLTMLYSVYTILLFVSLLIIHR